MANGTTDEKLARADRIKEQSARAQQAAEQHGKATRNAIASIRELLPERELPPYRVEMESNSEVTASPQGLTAKGIPRFAWWPISIGIGVAIAMFAWAAIQLVR